MNKVKILTWFVVVLLVLNVSAIVTVYLQKQKAQLDAQTIVIDAENNTKLTGRFFRQELNFDNQQMDMFRKANQSFHPKVRTVVFKLDSLKKENFTELNRAQPDSLILNDLAQKIGLQHAELKLVTNDFYLKLKSVCNEQQFKHMQVAFSPLYSTDTCSFRNMNGGRNRRNFNR